MASGLESAFRAFAARFPVLTAQPLIWGAMDAYQHLNNVAYIRLFESSRLEHFRAVMRRIPHDAATAAAAFDCQGWLAGRHAAGPILASTSCRYRVPLTFPDALVVGSAVTDVDTERLRFTLQHAVFSHRLGVVAAEGTGVVVLYDYLALRKASAFPPQLRQAIAAVEGATAARTEAECRALFHATGGGQRHDLI
jgi:acyl-CoA thioester hydrolase